MPSSKLNIYQTTATNEEIQRIIMHIQQDCAEKVDEVQVKAEEEFKNEKIREIVHGYSKVNEDFKLKEARTKSETLLYESKINNTSRLEFLKTKYDHVEDVLEKAKGRLKNKDTSDLSTQYARILGALILQGLCKLLEPQVVVFVRKVDVALARSVLADVKQDYQAVTSLPVSMVVKEGKYLPPGSEGGVLLTIPGGSITLDNTLSSRLDMIGFYLLPEIGRLLFGGRNKLSQGSIERRPSYLPSLSELEMNIEASRILHLN